jgi:predicted permease
VGVTALVLWKTRRQRLAETLLLSIAWLPIGPGLRVLLGERYAPLFGTLTAIGLVFVASWLGRLCALRLGGEQVTPLDRLRRLQDEAATTPLWPSILLPMISAALAVTALLLIADPIDRFGESIGGASTAVAVVALGAVATGAWVRHARRRLMQQDA